MSLNRIQKLYSTYAFQNMAEDAGEAGVEAMSKLHEPDALVMGKQIIERTYELPAKWYFIVYKPFDKPYARDPDFFKVKGLDKCRKSLKKPLSYIMTREIMSAKVHINAIVCTTEDLASKNESSYCSKYKLYVSELKSTGDRRRVLDYIMKEASLRPFTKYLDYLIYNRK